MGTLRRYPSSILSMSTRGRMDMYDLLPKRDGRGKKTVAKGSRRRFGSTGRDTTVVDAIVVCLLVYIHHDPRMTASTVALLCNPRLSTFLLFLLRLTYLQLRNKRQTLSLLVNDASTVQAGVHCPTQRDAGPPGRSLPCPACVI